MDKAKEDTREQLSSNLVYCKKCGTMWTAIHKKNGETVLSGYCGCGDKLQETITCLYCKKPLSFENNTLYCEKCDCVYEPLVITLHGRITKRVTVAIIAIARGLGSNDYISHYINANRTFIFFPIHGLHNEVKSILKILFCGLQTLDLIKKYEIFFISSVQRGREI